MLKNHLQIIYIIYVITHDDFTSALFVKYQNANLTLHINIIDVTSMVLQN